MKAHSIHLQKKQNENPLYRRKEGESRLISSELALLSLGGASQALLQIKVTTLQSGWDGP